MEYKPHTGDTIEYIYKYRSLAGDSAQYVDSILTQHKLYFVNPSRLNDPFECKPKYIMNGSLKAKEDYFNKVLIDRQPELNRSCRRKEINNILKNLSQIRYKKILESSRQQTLSQIGICSFSEVCDDILMWSHYANSHQGICIRFKASSTTPFFGESQPVKYQKDYPIIDIINDDDNQKLDKLIFTKSKHWGYEYEWRIAKRSRGPGEYKFPAELLDGVILGAKISNDDRKTVFSWLKEYDHDIKIFQAKLKESEYGIEFEKI